MKKIFLIFIGILSGLIIGIKGVNAATLDSALTTQYIDNVYAFHYRNGVLVSYGKLPYRYQNGNLSYCIDSSAVISESVYNSTTDWNMSGFTDEQRKQMELISYYGFGYEGHDTLRYYMATQELIWLFKDDRVKWTTDYDENSTELNVTAEKNEILSLVNKHNTVPSFANNQQYTQEFGTELNLTDTNGALKYYNVTGDLSFTKSNNTLKITPNKFGTYTFKLNHKRNVQKNTIVYYNSSSQKMASFGLNDVNSTFKVIVDKAYLRIYKKNAKTNQIIAKKGTIFKIKNITTNEYVSEDLKVNDSGKAEILLNKGNYEIEEINASYGYVVNKDKKTITIDDNIPITNSAYEIDFYNEVPKGSIKVNKVGEDGKRIPGVLIGLYDENYNLIDSLSTTLTDDIFSNLDLGVYYLKELDTIYGYIIDDSYHKVEINYKDDRTYVVLEEIKLVNKKIKCNIVYITSSEDKKLKDVEINVYDSNDNLVFNGKTDKNGKVTIEGLPYGKYYIKQVKVPRGYIISSDKYEFYVNDSTCVGAINVENEKTIMPVTTASVDKSICLCLMLSLFGIFNYVKKSN